jgi:hypothetical protein
MESKDASRGGLDSLLNKRDGVGAADVVHVLACTTKTYKVLSLKHRCSLSDVPWLLMFSLLVRDISQVLDCVACHISFVVTT